MQRESKKDKKERDGISNSSDSGFNGFSETLVNLEIEKRFIAACIVNQNNIDSTNVQSSDFYDQRHKDIFNAIKRLYITGKPINTGTIISECKTVDKEYIYDVTTFLDSYDASDYGEIIKRLSVGRRASIIGEALKKTVASGDVKKAIEITIQELTYLSQGTEDTVSSIYDAGLEAIQISEEIFNRKSDYVGYPLFGINKLDALTDGIADSEVVVISGEPGSGKSSLFNNILYKHLIDDLPCYAWSGELPKREVVYRIIPLIKRDLSSHFIRKGDFYNNSQQHEDVISCIEYLKNKNIFLDSGIMDINSITTKIKSLNRSFGVKTFLFDRLELFHTDEWKQEEGKAKIMNNLRNLSNSLNIKIIVATQLRKSTQNNINRIPGLNDLLGTGAISQSATKVIFVHRPEAFGVLEMPDGSSSQGKAILILAKNTYGPTGNTMLYFDKKRFCFVDDIFNVDNVPF